MKLVKDGKAGFFQDHQDRCEEHCNGILQCGREIGLNSRHRIGKWEVIAKEQSGG